MHVCVHMCLRDLSGAAPGRALAFCGPAPYTGARVTITSISVITTIIIIIVIIWLTINDINIVIITIIIHTSITFTSTPGWL